MLLTPVSVNFFELKEFGKAKLDVNDILVIFYYD